MGTNKSQCFELSRAEVDQMVIRELRRRHHGALPISIDYEPKTDGGFCHVWWCTYETSQTWCQNGHEKGQRGCALCEELV